MTFSERLPPGFYVLAVCKWVSFTSLCMSRQHIGMSKLRLNLGLLDLKTANAWTHIEHDARNNWFADLNVFSEQSRSCFSRWKICLRPWGDKTSKTSTLSTLSTLHLVFGSQDAIYLANVSECINVSECHINGYVSTWDKWSWNLPGSLQLYDVANHGAPRWTWRTENWWSGELNQVGSVWFQMLPHIKMIHLIGVINFLWDGTGSRIGFPIFHTYITISFTCNLSWNAGKPMSWKLIKDFGSWHELQRSFGADRSRCIEAAPLRSLRTGSYQDEQHDKEKLYIWGI